MTKDTTSGSRCEKIIRWAQKIPPFIVTVVLLAIIFYLTLSADPFRGRKVPMFPGSDKIAHAILFGVLALSMIRDLLVVSRRKYVIAMAVLGGLLSAAVGIGVEFIQEAMRVGRSFEVGDMISDVCGAIIAVVLVVWHNNHSR